MKAPQYITDDKGNKLSVVIPVKDYEMLIEAMEDLEDIRLYDEAITDKGESIPADQAFYQIEEKRKKPADGI